MPDRLTKGISRDKEIRFFTAHTAEVIEQGRKIHSLTPVKTLLFGKLLTAGLIFGSDLKDERYLVTLKTESREGGDYVLVTANNRGQVKGYPNLCFAEEGRSLQGKNPLTLNSELRAEIKKIFKGGLFTLIKDIGGKTPYTGSTSLITGEIARDITYYLSVSEQIPSIVGLSVTLNEDGTVKEGVGFLIQLLPEASEETIDRLEKNMQMLPEIIDLLEMGYTIQRILSELILKDIEHETTWESGAEYHCDCSLERFERGLMLLRRDELEEIKGNETRIPLQCHYCNEAYEVEASTIERIISEKDKQNKES